ncbi:MAG: hypothetical protein LBR84_06165 [Tannerella sp.]|jgi:4-hydroxybenzoate polyprenyltransferase|nr:hypothetical protein [Tannerella sp.]
MKKHDILTIALLVYLLVMSYIGWPGRNNSMNYTEYFIVIAISIVMIFLLRYLRLKVDRMRKKKEKDEIQ